MHSGRDFSRRNDIFGLELRTVFANLPVTRVYIRGMRRGLPMIDAHCVDRRVVKDRKRMTGGGGLNFALAPVAEMKGEEVARRADSL